MGSLSKKVRKNIKKKESGEQPNSYGYKFTWSWSNKEAQDKKAEKKES